MIFRMKTWVNYVGDKFPQYANETFFKDNPLLKYYKGNEYRPCSVKILEPDKEDTYYYNQVVYLMSENNGWYPHIICNRQEEYDGDMVYMAINTPFISTVDKARNAVALIRKQESMLICERKRNGKSNPTVAFANEYISLRENENPDAEVNVEMINHDRDGAKINELSALYNKILNDNNFAIPPWASSLTECAYLIAVNYVVNKYWITHLLCGSHARYLSVNELEIATKYSLVGRPRLHNYDGVPVSPVLYRVLIKPLQGIKKELSFVNSSLLSMYSIGACTKTSIGTFYRWLINQVDSKGEGLTIAGKFFQISDRQAEQNDMLFRINNLIKNLEIDLPFVAAQENNAINMPLIAVIQSNNTLPIKDYMINDLSKTTRKEDLIITTHVLENFMG